MTTSPDQLIVLNLIMKDEEKVIERCLRSFAPFCNSWCIVDTGSSDRSKEIVVDFFKKKGIPGQLHERPWVDFEHNRNEALQLVRDMAGDKLEQTWCICADADEEFKPDKGFALPKPLVAHQYSTDIQHGCRFARTRLYRCDLWEWWYPTHEALCPIKPFNEIRRHLSHCFVQSYTDGARAKDASRWLRDAASLDAAIEVREKGETWRGKELKLSRLLFYSGNSYFHAEDYENALLRYGKRIKIAEFDEEIFQAYYMIAKAKVGLKRGREEIMGAFLEAYSNRPTRYEPIYHLIKYLMERGDYEIARLFADRMMQATPPPDVLFVEEWCYKDGKRLAGLLLKPSTSESIALAVNQYVQKRWVTVLETLKPLKLAKIKTLSQADKFTYYDLQYIAHSWLGQKTESIAAVRKIFEIPLRHWKPSVSRLVSYYVDNYQQPLDTVPKDVQLEFLNQKKEERVRLNEELKKAKEVEAEAAAASALAAADPDVSTAPNPEVAAAAVVLVAALVVEETTDPLK